jgi:hypothetical protein
MSSTTPHENFLHSLLLSVGRDIRNFQDFDKYRSHALANGNVQYQYTRRIPPGRHPCTTIYDVDPQTYKIVRADFKGSRDDCVIQP